MQLDHSCCCALMDPLSWTWTWTKREGKKGRLASVCRGRIWLTVLPGKERMEGKARQMANGRMNGRRNNGPDLEGVVEPHANARINNAIIPRPLSIVSSFGSILTRFVGCAYVDHEYSLSGLTVTCTGLRQSIRDRECAYTRRAADIAGFLSCDSHHELITNAVVIVITTIIGCVFMFFLVHPRRFNNIPLCTSVNMAESALTCDGRRF